MPRVSNGAAKLVFGSRVITPPPHGPDEHDKGPRSRRGPSMVTRTGYRVKVVISIPSPAPPLSPSPVNVPAKTCGSRPFTQTVTT